MAITKHFLKRVCTTSIFLFLGCFSFHQFWAAELIPKNTVQIISVQNISRLQNYQSLNNYTFSEEHKILETSRKVTMQRLAFPGDPACVNFSKRLYEENTFGFTPLVSYPGSGNTWTRHLIELASGIYTGSIYTDLDLLARGFAGEREPPDAGSTIVQKIHLSFSEELAASKAILIIRDPYKAVVSFVQYLESGHLGQASVQTFRRKEWTGYILSETYKWISLAKSWIESPVELLVLHYENLLGESRMKELEKICKFLKVPCPNLFTECFKTQSEGSFHRKRKPRVGPSFPPWVKDKVNRGIEYLNEILIQHRHAPLPLNHYPYYYSALT